ncbi:MAG: hypothetical protein LBL47_00175 [Lactobacillus sp.]|jgi:hypothetical protein|nr:hypothetical protein [Lactobacillus sp.]
MKSVAGSILILLLIFFAYWAGIFDLFASKGALVWAIGLVIIVFIVGFLVIGGGPASSGVKDKEDENK